MQNTWTIEAFVKFSRMKKSWIKWIKYKIYVSQSTNNYKISNAKYNNENFSSKRTIHFHLGKIQLERIPESMISTLPPSTWSKARSLRSQPVARYLLNHNTASRAKKKRKKKQNKQLRSNEDCVPFLSTSRHPARGRAAILRPWRRWTPTTDEKSVKSPQKTIHGFTLTDQPPICTPFRFAQSDALRSFHRTIDPWNINGAEGRRTGVGDNGLHLFDERIVSMRFYDSHRLLLQCSYRMLVFNSCIKCFFFSWYSQTICSWSRSFN